MPHRQLLNLHTNIENTAEIINGSPFVTIDFKETPFQLIFVYTYELGRIQCQLVKEEEEQLLPLEWYPFPPNEDEEQE
ncbi:hypothetical protein AMQ68_04470 [Chryseobacterium sp. ERMR1:04]|nr:hypothetical protein AMQ68_04470 [Chryseobacterium sp. ERMR1:04]